MNANHPGDLYHKHNFDKSKALIICVTADAKLSIDFINEELIVVATSTRCRAAIFAVQIASVRKHRSVSIFKNYATILSDGADLE